MTSFGVEGWALSTSLVSLQAKGIDARTPRNGHINRGQG